MIPSLEYPSCRAYTLTQEYLEDIQHPLIPLLLNSTGVHRNFPQDLVYAPLYYHSLETRLIWYYNREQQCAMLCDNL